MEMAVAIVDDAEADRNSLYTLLQTFFERYDFKTSFFLFSSGEAFIENLEPDLYDLVFMDIYMNGKNGMETCAALSQIDPDCTVVFATSSTDFAIHGYAFNTLRYLLKPITAKHLEEMLPAFVDARLQTDRRLTVRSGRRDYQVPFSQILYVVSNGNNIEIQLKSTRIVHSRHICFADTVAPLLKDYRFVQCCKGIVLNMAYVEKLLAHDIQMVTGELLPVSRREYASVKHAYLNYCFKNIT